MVSLRAILAVPLLLGLTATALPNPVSPLNNDLAVPHTSTLNAYDVREIHLDHPEGDGGSDGFAGGRTILRKPGSPEIILSGEGTSITGFGQTIVHTGNKTRIYLWNPETLLFEQVKEQDQAPSSHLNVYQARITIPYHVCPPDPTWDNGKDIEGARRKVNVNGEISRITIIKNGLETICVCNTETKAWEKYYEGPDGSDASVSAGITISGCRWDDQELFNGGVSIANNRRMTIIKNDKKTVYVCNNGTKTWDKEYEGPNDTNGAGMKFPAGSSMAVAVAAVILVAVMGF